MDVNTIQTAISTLGFPIVCVLFLGWFIWKIWMSQQDQNKEREDKLYEYLGKAQAVNEELTIPVTLYGYTTIRSYASELGFAANRKYKTSRNKEARTYTIKRIS